jgi:hypothetical protein
MPVEEPQGHDSDARRTMTSDDEFAASARSDALVALLLGHTLETATIRLALLLLLASVIAAVIARFA